MRLKQTFEEEQGGQKYLGESISVRGNTVQSTDALCHPMPGSKMSNVTVRELVLRKKFRKRSSLIT